MSDKIEQCIIRLETKFEAFAEQYEKNRENAIKESSEHRETVQQQIGEMHTMLTGNGKMGIAQKTHIMWKIGPYAGGGILIALGGPKLWPYISALLF